MGFLHDGHISLVHAARKSCESVVVSIFVNPSQFEIGEDLSTYPRDLEHDIALLKNENVDLVWVPEADMMYPPHFQTWVEVEDVAQPLEGVFRPGHFKGVATVVAKIFNSVRPTRAYFGQKDAQQVIVIQQMVRDLNFNLEIVVCPTIREPDGLAVSSRNSYLSPSERKSAGVLYAALSAAQERYTAGERDANILRTIMTEAVSKEPLARLQYVSCAQPENLDDIDGKIDGRALLSLAVFIGSTRLIDNVLIGDQ